MRSHCCLPAYLLLCSDIRFARADQMDDNTVSIISSDNDGWLRIRVNLERLNSSCSSTFDRIIFADVSGMGFNLQLDDMRLLYGDAVANFAASGFTFPTQTGSLLPVFGDDLTAVSLVGHCSAGVV